MSLPELIIVSNRQKVARIAQDLLDGRIGIIEGSRQLSGLRFRVGGDERDPDFLTFAGIDSETDNLPIGRVRQHWAPDALEAKDAEIARYEAMVRDLVREAASHLVQRFVNEKAPPSASDYYTPET